MIIDTHCHLYSEAFEDVETIVARAQEAGVAKIFMPNVESNSIEGMLALEEKYKGYCVPMMGLHPCSVKENYKQELELVKSWFEKRKFVAVGEIGIDKYWDVSLLDKQIEAFKFQIELAIENNVPIIIHCREAFEEVINVLEEYKNKGARGVLHCFTGSMEEANKLIDLGYYIGIGGVVTFKKSGLDEVVKNIPMDKIVLETDAPYLAPLPFRGKRNEPAYVKLVAEKICEIKQLAYADVAKITSQNASNLFGIPC